MLVVLALVTFRLVGAVGGCVSPLKVAAPGLKNGSAPTVLYASSADCDVFTRQSHSTFSSNQTQARIPGSCVLIAFAASEIHCAWAPPCSQDDVSLTMIGLVD